MVDYAARRTIMVDSQVRPNEVTKFPIIEAFLSVPREEYVPIGLKSIAYAEQDIPLSANRVILEPRTISKMLQELDLQPESLVLEIGTGLGYGAAVLSTMVEAVVAVEEDPDMAKQAQDTLTQNGIFNAAVVNNPLIQGAPEQGPYDAIVIIGAVDFVPDAITAQLRENGQIAALFRQGKVGVVRIGTFVGGLISWRDAFNAFAPVLPGFEHKLEFTL